MSNIILEKDKNSTLNDEKILKKSRFLSIKDKSNNFNFQRELNPINENLYEDYARIKFNDILTEAICKNASDIHIEPFGDEVIVRIRIDGNLRNISTIPIESYSFLLTLIKLDSGMNIAEKRLPQDGRMEKIITEIIVDIRTSTIPTVYGEKVVLRILNRESIIKDKSELGFSKKAIEKIEKIINKKSGILLVTGSTGSGKTTTVYSILNDLLNSDKNIMTIEDPVEYKIKGINQIEVNNKIGLTFDIGLRSILRQDPDIIMVGEIRDIETAKTAIRAASTGHLVISTIHTNDTISSINRLIEMKLPPYLISSTLIGIISQKLVRKKCTSCNNYILDKDFNSTIKLDCDKCDNTGYSGRCVMYEILEVTENLKESINNWTNNYDISSYDINDEIITFEESAKYLIENDITTAKECGLLEDVLYATN